MRGVLDRGLLPLALVFALCLPAAASAEQHYPRLPTGPHSFVRHRRARSASSNAHSKPKPKPKPKLSRAQLTEQQDISHAVLAFHAMQQSFYIEGTGLYQGEPTYSFLWPFSQALAATVSLSDVPGQSAKYASELHARMVGLQSYLDTDNSGAEEGAFTSDLTGFDGTVVPPKGSGGAKYYDDNEWVGIELIRVYELTGETSALEQAEEIMAFVESGWQANPKFTCSGGEPFSNSSENNTRNTVTTAPGAELAVLLYRTTGQGEYLSFAEMAYEWVRACMVESNLLYADHIGNKGVQETTEWSYNQGTMIGAGTLLYQATGNVTYLSQARQIATAALGYFTPERLAGENPFFVVVYFRNLLYLDALTGDPPGPTIAQNYVNYLSSYHLSSSGLYSTAAYPPQLLVQAAVTQIYALLVSPPASYL
jgi:hypothetical protein